MRLVISAVNLVEGGTLTVLRDVVKTVTSRFPDVEVIALVNRLGLTGSPIVKEIAFPRAKRSWLNRMWLEWFGMMKVSDELRPDVWLSLQDITPRIRVSRQYVYCQNPSPFCDVRIPLERLEWKFWMFRRFYGFIYGVLIHRNRAVIVQQDWLRAEFKRRYNVKNVIVAYPYVAAPSLMPESSVRTNRPKHFFYPALPRVIKNFDVLGKCALILDRDPGWDGSITLTIDGTENEYARLIRSRYGHSRSLRFIGLQPHDRMPALYAGVDALIFPSLLETWGLPLTESKQFNLPIVVADRPYAREAVGDYGSVAFFDPLDSAGLAALLLSLHNGHKQFHRSSAPQPEEPFAESYERLLEMILHRESISRESVK